MFRVGRTQEELRTVFNCRIYDPGAGLKYSVGFQSRETRVSSDQQHSSKTDDAKHIAVANERQLINAFAKLPAAKISFLPLDKILGDFSEFQLIFKAIEAG